MGRFANQLSESAKRTNSKLASKISSFTRLKDAEINRIAPKPIDKKHLNELLQVVNEATTENKKIAKLKTNFDKFSGTIIKLIKYV